MFVIIIVAAAPAFASKDTSSDAETPHHVIDDNGKLSDKDRAALEKSAAKVYGTYGVDIFVYLSDDVIPHPQSAGEKIYDSKSYVNAAVIMMCDPDDTYVCAYGRASHIFTSDELDGICTLSEGQKGYRKIFSKFISEVGERLNALGVQPIPEERLLPRLVDDAELLDGDEEGKLLKKLDRISEDQQLDVVIVTKYSLDGKTSTQYADDFFDYNGYGFGQDHDGILLLIGMEDRDWAISTTGKGIDVFTDKGQQYMTDRFVPYLSNGEYYDSFVEFADLCDEFITRYDETGVALDYGDMSERKPSAFEFARSSIIGSIIVGLAVGFINAIILMRDLKSVSSQTDARTYTVQGSLKITTRSDLFLYNVVNRTARPSNDSNSSNSRGSSENNGSSTHYSSSGESHGGSSGHF